MTKLPEKLKRVLQTHVEVGSVVTYSELAELTGLKESSLRNYKSQMESLGYKIERKKNSFGDFKLNKNTVLAVANAIFYIKDYPVPFILKPESKSLYHVYKKKSDRLEEYAKFLLSVLASKKVHLTMRETNLCYRAYTFATQTIHTKLSKEDRDEYTKVFEEFTGFTPNNDQLKLIDNIVKYLKGTLLPEEPLAHIQAVAGASKSTCTKVALTYLYSKEYFKNNSIPVLAKTNTVSSAFEGYNNSTVEKFLNDKLDSNIVGATPRDIKDYLDIKIKTNSLHREDLIIVDEHTMLEDHLVEALVLCSKRILFLGDVSQICRNEYHKGPCIGALSKSLRFLESENTLQTEVIQFALEKDIEGLESLVRKHSSGSLKSFLTVQNSDNTLTLRRDYSKSFEEDFLSDVKGVCSLNSIVIAYSANCVKNINKHLNDGTEQIKIGSKVILKEPFYDKGVMYPKNSFWYVIDIQSKKALLFHPEKGQLLQSLRNLELGYAITTTKAQGLEWTFGVYIGYTSREEDFIQDVTTGITRFKNNVIVYILTETEKDILDKVKELSE